MPARRGPAAGGFVRRHGVRVVVGAPVCAAERIAAVVGEFEREATGAGDRVCYFGAEARLEGLLRGCRSHAVVRIGSQPVWRPERWPDIVAGRASLRAQLNRARNKGVTVAEWPNTQASGSPALHRCLGEWLATRGLPPMHFLVEPETLERLFDRRASVAERGGAVVAFLVASPAPERHGWLVEQIIRGSRAPNGAAELMLDAAMRALAASGSRYLTLGLAPLSRRADTPAVRNPLLLRATLEWARAHGRRFYNFDGLDAFKARSRPDRWDPVFAVASEPRFSPVTLYAIAAVFSGGSPLALVGRAGQLTVAARPAPWA